jgi:hypothetical protein
MKNSRPYFAVSSGTPYNFAWALPEQSLLVRSPAELTALFRVGPRISKSLVQYEISNITIGRAAWEAYSATWNLGTNSAFALGPRKTTETLIELAGRRTFRMQLTSSQRSSIKSANPNISPYSLLLYFSFLFFFFFLFFHNKLFCFYNYLYVHMIWKSTKPYKTLILVRIAQLANKRGLKKKGLQKKKEITEPLHSNGHLSIVTHVEALNLSIWRCATGHSSSCL